ncbi:hypothetical protein, partial [Vibrio sp.]|uniref:hypothetical protein n=1 Tax=Vibrio sp. TaxID=678 RepID=UPI003F6ABFE8
NIRPHLNFYCQNHFVNTWIPYTLWGMRFEVLWIAIHRFWLNHFYHKMNLGLRMIGEQTTEGISAFRCSSKVQDKMGTTCLRRSCR